MTSHDDGARDAARRGAQPRQGSLRPAARLPPVRTWPRTGAVGADWLADNDIVYVVSPHRWSARRRRAQPIAAAHGLTIDTDDDLIESWNHFEGEKVAPGDGALRDPRNWRYLRNPRTPSWGEPYVHVAARMQAALHRARDPAEGHEAVCVSHQLPVETLRRSMTDRQLHHLPLRAQPVVQSRVVHVVHVHR